MPSGFGRGSLRERVNTIQNRFFVSRTRGWVHLPPPEAVPYPCFTLDSLFPSLVLRFVPYLGFGEGGKIRDAPPEAAPYLYFSLFSLFRTLVLQSVPYFGFGEGWKIRDARITKTTPRLSI